MPSYFRFSLFLAVLMLGVLKLTLMALAGLFLGLGISYFVVNSDFGFFPMRLGAWVAWPSKGQSESDPYMRAKIARTGEAPLSTAEGLAFNATTDDNGAPLTGNCDYMLSGSMPIARFWTLNVSDAQGAPYGLKLPRSHFTSSEIIRAEDGAFEIHLTAEAHDGNWLPVPANRAFVLWLRFYDTPLSGPDPSMSLQSLPLIHKMACI